MTASRVVDRRGFLRTAGIWTFGGLIAGPAIIETVEGWTRSLFALGGTPAVIELSDAEVAGMLRRIYADFSNQIFPMVTPLLAQLPPAPSKYSARVYYPGLLA